MRWKIALVLVFTLACLVWVLWGIDLDNVKVGLGAFRWERIFWVFVLYAVTHALRVIRFRWILGVPIRFVPLLSIVSVGYLAINVTPLRMGELVRPWLLAERHGVPFGAGMAAVFVERLVDMVALLVMLWIVAFGVDLQDHTVVVQGVDLLAFGQRLAGGVVVGGTGGLAVMVLLGERALRWTDRLPLGILVRRFVEGIRGLVARPREMAAIAGITSLLWLCTLWSVQVSLSAFPGFPADLVSALQVWTLTLLGMAAIPTPGFFGGFEAACVAGMALVGVVGDDARTFAIILHLCQFGFTIAWGLCFLVYEGLSLREVVDQSRRALSDVAP